MKGNLVTVRHQVSPRRARQLDNCPGFFSGGTQSKPL
jgi:hypothetical protein